MTDSNGAPAVVPFTKVEAVGNDFVLVDARSTGDLDWPELARLICVRRFAVGADGLLVYLPSDVADFRMRMFNPDGTEDFCGNGIRCMCVYHAQVAHIPAPAELRVETTAGIRKACILDHTATGAGPRPIVRVDMGCPLFHPNDIPARFDGDSVIRQKVRVAGHTLEVTSLSVGTTHSVIFAPRSEYDRLFLSASPALEVHEAYPERTSVLWADASDAHRIHVRIWERGVGETLGCGTGACAVAVAARLNGITTGDVQVVSRGGALTVSWDGRGSVFLSGPAAILFSGRWKWPERGCRCTPIQQPE
ncbi:MAG: diaminopimelate epimerase [Armatimonadota bacterium]